MDTRIRGITVRGNSIVMNFTDANGIRHRETIRLNMPPTKQQIQEAGDKLRVIMFEIQTGTFDYAKHFPTSKKAIRYSRNPGALITIKEALEKWRRHQWRDRARSTMRGYESAIYQHLIPTFGAFTLAQLTASQVKDWIITLDVNPKTINNILVPLRGVMTDAFHEGLIDRNPMDRVKNLRLISREPEPFTPQEIDAILGQLDGQDRNLIQFAFWSGLRTSELIGLRWKDVDFEKNVIRVRNAVVHGHEKSTKTSAGQRDVLIQPQALEALKDQLQHTGAHKEWVFHDPKTNKRWKDDRFIRKRVWMPALSAASIKYRNPYQTRHTFASTLLSRGENPLWVANQMGHKDWGMIRKTYGRWLSL